jgi:hypothetical protein
MVKLIGPLHSFTAQGAFAKSLTYARLGHTNYAKAYAVPANPQTPAQQLQRAVVSAITKGWTHPQNWFKTTWATYGEEPSRGPYHNYLVTNLHRWSTFRAIGWFPIDYTAYVIGSQELIWTPNGDNYEYTITVTSPNPDVWCASIAVSETTPFTPTKNHIAIFTADFTEIETDVWQATGSWPKPDLNNRYAMMRSTSYWGGLTEWTSQT